MLKACEMRVITEKAVKRLKEIHVQEVLDKMEVIANYGGYSALFKADELDDEIIKVLKDQGYLVEKLGGTDKMIVKW